MCQAYGVLISIHAPHEGSDQGVLGLAQDHSEISIHAPHEGSDVIARLKCVAILISIHAPHEGSDTELDKRYSADYEFQSTLPMRGATGPSSRRHTSWQFQSTLPMRGATGCGLHVIAPPP